MVCLPGSGTDDLKRPISGFAASFIEKTEHSPVRRGILMANRHHRSEERDLLDASG